MKIRAKFNNSEEIHENVVKVEINTHIETSPWGHTDYLPNVKMFRLNGDSTRSVFYLSEGPNQFIEIIEDNA